MALPDLPFLPEHVPDVDPAEKKTKAKRARRTLLLWVLLILMFLAIWQFLQPGPSASHQATPPPPPCEATMWSAVSGWAIPFGAFLLLFFVFMRAYGQNVEFARSTEPAARALAERRFGDAAKLYTGLIASNKKKPAYQSSARASLAFAELMGGRLAAAIEVYAQVERAQGVLFSSGVRTTASTWLAFAYALRGDVPAGQKWATEARRRLTKNNDNRLSYASQMCLAEAALAIRAGEAERGVSLLDAGWLNLRESMTANTMRVAEVLRAFAESSRGPRGYNVVEERLTRVEPVVPGEFDFLGVEWPEMRAFLAAHKLGGAPAGARDEAVDRSA